MKIPMRYYAVLARAANSSSSAWSDIANAQAVLASACALCSPMCYFAVLASVTHRSTAAWSHFEDAQAVLASA